MAQDPISQSARQQSPSTNLDPLRQQLKEELEQTLLIDDETERQFWLSSLATLPKQTVENLLKALIPKNQQVNYYINTALAQDQNEEHLKDLQNQIKKIKQEAFKIEEKSESKSEQKSEEELLGELDQI